MMAYSSGFDQQKWPHCTIFAISKAVCMACDDHDVLTSSEQNASVSNRMQAEKLILMSDLSVKIL